MKYQSTNRLAKARTDCLLLIVRKPDHWKPTGDDDEPPVSHVLSVTQVASYEEAREDLIRCNQLSLRHNLNEWAVVHTPSRDL